MSIVFSGGKDLKTLQKSEMQELLRTIASTQGLPNQHLFISMSNQLSNHSQEMSLSETVDEMKQLKDSISTDDDMLLHSGSPSHLTQTTTFRKKLVQHTESSQSTKTRQKAKHTITQTRRVILEKDGTKTTTEEKIKDSKQFTELIESLTVFKSEKEVDEFVERTTTTYESKLNEYAKNVVLIETALEKWMCELHQSRQLANLNFESIRQLVTNSNLELEQKFDAIYCRLIDILLATQPQLSATHSQSHSQHSATPLPHDPFKFPVLQQIVKYTMQTFPDGNLKVFHCKFGDHKFSEHFIIVSVPEILLRAFSFYSNQLHAFFIVKFIPFMSAFMKHRRQLEIDFESADETNRQGAIESTLAEVDNPYQDSRFPEIDPRMCFIKKMNCQ